MNKSESKYFRTALCMDEALLALLKEKDLEYITIKEICAKAGVNRSTFYLHYGTISDLLNETIEMVNQRFMAYFSEKTKAVVEDISYTDLVNLVFIQRDYLQPYLQFVRDNKDIYRAAFRNPVGMQVEIQFGQIKQSVVEPILKRFGAPEVYWKYYIAYYIEGTMAIIREWLNTDCQDSIDLIVAVIEKCIHPPEHIEGERHGETDE